MKSASKRQPGIFARTMSLFLCLGLVFGLFVGPATVARAEENGTSQTENGVYEALPPYGENGAEGEYPGEYDENGYEYDEEEYDGLYAVGFEEFGGFVPFNTGLDALIHHWPLEYYEWPSPYTIWYAPALVGIDGRLFPGTSFVADAAWGRDVLSIDFNSATPHAVRVENFGEPAMSALTATFWARPNDLTAGQLQNFLSFQYPWGNSDFAYGLFDFSYDSGFIGLGNGTIPFGAFNAANFNNEWVHFALIFDGTSARLYVDGVPFGTPISGNQTLHDWWVTNTPQVVSMRVPNIDHLGIGGLNPGQFFNGRMADVRLYEYALTSAQVAQVYALAPAAVRGVSGATPALIHHWPLIGNGDDIVGNEDATVTLTMGSGWVNDDDWGRQVLNLSTPNAGTTNPFRVDTLDPTGIDALTVSMWLRPTEQYGAVTNFMLLEEPTGANSGLFYLSYFQSRIGIGSGDASNIPFNYATRAGEWMHLALTFEAGASSLFINGVLFETHTGSVNINNWWDGTYSLNLVPIRMPNLDIFSIGGDNETQLVNGRIADVRLFDGALNATQVNAVFMAAPDAVRGVGETPPTMLHHWILDGDGDDEIGTLPAGYSPATIAPAANFIYDADWGRDVLNLTTPGAAGGGRPSPFEVTGLDAHNLDELTLSFWLRPSNLNPATQGLTNLMILEQPTGINSGLFHLSNWHTASGHSSGLTNVIGFGSSDAPFGAFNWDTNANRWVHIALTFYDDVATMYVNGAFFGYIEDEVTIGNWWGFPNPATVPVRAPNLDILGIGGNHDGQVVNGRFADVRLYGSSLTAAQVNAVFMEAPPAVRGIQGDMLHRWLMDDTGQNTGTSGRHGNIMVPYASFVYDVAWGDYVLYIDTSAPSAPFPGSGPFAAAPFEAHGPAETFTDATFMLWVREVPNSRPNFHFFLRGDEFNIGRGAAHVENSRLFASHLDFVSDPPVPPAVDIWGNVVSDVDAFPLSMQSTWTHVAYVVGDGFIRYYVNGLPVGSTPFTGTITIEDYLIGGGTWQTQIFPGRIADFRVYDRVLTAQEVFDVFDAVTLNPEPTLLTLTATSTNRPNTNLFYQGAAESITVTVSGMDSMDNDDAYLSWQITNWLGNVVGSGTHTFLGSGADIQNHVININTSALGLGLGWFNLEATLEDASADVLTELPTQGTLSLNSLPFGIVPNPANRRLNARHGSGGTVIPGPNGEGIDEFISFGIWNVHPGTMPDGVVMSDMLGASMSSSSSLSWWHFVTPSVTHPSQFYPNNPLDPNRRTNVTALQNIINTPNHGLGNLLRGHVYQLLEMSAYFPMEFRVFPGLGAYGGQMNQLGEEEFYLYARYLAKIHIAHAPLRPRHYFMPLWEPNHQWGAWFPGGDEGIQSIVRAHEIAYLAIHTAYAEHAAATGDPSWLNRAVVLGPNSSSFYPSWHQELFDAGLANFIDGLTIHAYHGSPNDQAFLNSTRQVMNSALEAWEERDDNNNGQGFPKFHDRFFFFQTEGGLFRDPSLTELQGIEQQMQLLTRQMLIMLGEGFDHYQMFIMNDGSDPITRFMGIFYSLDGIPFGPSYIAPKPVATAFAAASYLLTGYETGGPLALGGSNLGYAFLDTITDSVKLALWNFSTTPTTVSINVGHNSVTVYDIMGNPQTVTAPGGVLTITLNRNVQYVSGVNPALFREEGALVVVDAERFIGDGLTVDVEFYNETGAAINNATVTLMFGVGSGIPNAVLTGQNFAPGMNRLTINAGNIPFTTMPDDYPISASIANASGNMIAVATGNLRVRPKIEIVLVQNFYDFTAGNGAMAVLLDNVSDEEKTVTFTVREGAFVHFTMGPFTMRANEERSILVPLDQVDLLTGANLIIEVAYVDAQNVTVTRPHEAIFTMMNYQRDPLPMSQISDIDAWRDRVIPIWRGAEHQYQFGGVDFFPGLTDDNVSGFLYFGWDAGGIWFGADITRDIHINNATANGDIWSGSAIQLAFNVNHLAELAGSEWTTGEIVTELGLALTTGDIQRFHKWIDAPGATGSMGPYFIDRDNANNRTVYMAYIPWAFLGMPAEVAVAGYQIGVSVSINYRYAPGSHWSNQTAITLFGGVVNVKDFNAFGPLTLVSDVEFILTPRLRAEAGNQNVTLYWSEAIPGADGYRIYVNGQLVETVAGNVTSFVVTGLTNGTAYTFEVVATSDRFNDGASNMVTATPVGTGAPPPPPPPPTPIPSETPTSTPRPPQAPVIVPIVEAEVTITEDELLQAIEDGETIVIEEDGVTLTIPSEILEELVGTPDEDGDIGDLEVSITVWPPEFNPVEGENTLLYVEWSITIGDEAVTGTETDTAFTLTFNLEELGIELEGVNTYRIVAVLEDGTLVGGVFDPETGLFTLETQNVGSFAIVYAPTLNRFQLRLNSYDIMDLVPGVVVVEMDVFPVIVNNRTLVPLRFVAYAMGWDVDWDGANRTALLTSGSQSLEVVIGQLAPGMDVPAQIMNNRTMVPLRFVSEFFGAVVNWCAATRTIDIIRIG